MEIWGLETVFKYQKDKFGLNASHTYTDGEDKSLEDAHDANRRLKALK